MDYHQGREHDDHQARPTGTADRIDFTFPGLSPEPLTVGLLLPCCHDRVSSSEMLGFRRLLHARQPRQGTKQASPFTFWDWSRCTRCEEFNGFSNLPDKVDIDLDILHGSLMEVVECGRK